jgi:hypothetical protein
LQEKAHITLVFLVVSAFKKVTEKNPPESIVSRQRGRDVVVARLFSVTFLRGRPTL